MSPRQDRVYDSPGWLNVEEGSVCPPQSADGSGQHPAGSSMPQISSLCGGTSTSRLISLPLAH